METALIVELLRAVWRELIYWRTWVFGAFMVVTFVALGVGVKWPEYYQTSALIYADNSNIIKPLLQGRAEVTDIDRSKQAGELIYTRKILLQVANATGLITPTTQVDRQEAIIGSLRRKIEILNEGKSYFRISYSDESQDQSFNVLNSVVDAFIKDSSASRRDESRAAFEFIDQQVITYKRQLLIAEENLKQFQSKNFDGTTASVSARINQLRLQIEDQKLVISETEAKKKNIEDQLKVESKNVQTASKLDAQKKRLDALWGQLDILRLSYQETYPDIVTLKEKIESQELVIQALEGGDYIASNENVENPLYEQLRDRSAQAETDLLSQQRRLKSMNRMLEEEYLRAERVASKQAELAELNRDYSVTKGIYEEMLGRKEKARLSMTLDVEGQGVSFKIQEPPVYPLHPSGIQFVHFAVASPIVGLLAALGLVVVYVLLDARVRSPILLTNSLPSEVELLAVIPHVNTPLGERLLRSDMLLLGFVFIVFSGFYATLVYSRFNGFI